MRPSLAELSTVLALGCISASIATTAVLAESGGGDALLVGGKFYAFAEVYIQESGRVSFDVDWNWRNVVQGGHDSIQRYILTNHDVLSFGYFVSIYTCIANVTAGYGNPIVGFEPPLCSTEGSQTHSTWDVPLNGPGEYTLIMARAGDFLESASINVTVEGGELKSVGQSERSYLATLDDFQGSVAGAYVTLLGAQFASGAEFEVSISDRLFGTFVEYNEGIDEMSLEIEGPINQAGQSGYLLYGLPPGRWHFQADGHAAGIPFTFLHVIDFPHTFS